MTYHSEVVGSLLRPAYLADARKQFESGQLNAADFKTMEDRAVNEAIALQEAAGIDVITDGEIWKALISSEVGQFLLETRRESNLSSSVPLS